MKKNTTKRHLSIEKKIEIIKVVAQASEKWAKKPVKFQEFC